MDLRLWVKFIRIARQMDGRTHRQTECFPIGNIPRFTIEIIPLLTPHQLVYHQETVSTQGELGSQNSESRTRK